MKIAAVIAMWYIACRIDLFHSYLLPAPEKVLDTWIEMLVSGELITDILVSFIRVMKGFCISFSLAFVFALPRAFKRKGGNNFDFLIQFFRNVPPLALIPLLILWCGIGEMTKILIIILASFFPMYLSIEKGFAGCDQRLLEVGEVFGYQRYQKFSKIIFPYALPDILVGMRIGMGYSWRAIIGAEMVAASTGLGHMILFAQQMSRTDKVIVGILVIGITGYLVDRCFGILIRKLTKGAGEHGWN